MVNDNEPKYKSFQIGDLPIKEKASDSDIWDAFRMGSESAFISIYQTHFDNLFSYGFKICNSEALVKDAIQDLFIELRKSRSRLGQTDSIKFYLFKCIKRKLIKEEKKWYSSLEQIDSNYFFDFSFSPEELLINKQIDEEKSNKLSEAIQQLSPRKREVVYYFFYEGMTYKEIQEIMNLDNIKSVRNLIYRSLGFLRNLM